MLLHLRLVTRAGALHHCRFVFTAAEATHLLSPIQRLTSAPGSATLCLYQLHNTSSIPPHPLCPPHVLQIAVRISSVHRVASTNCVTCCSRAPANCTSLIYRSSAIGVRESTSDIRSRQRSPHDQITDPPGRLTQLPPSCSQRCQDLREFERQTRCPIHETRNHNIGARPHHSTTSASRISAAIALQDLNPQRSL